MLTRSAVPYGNYIASTNALIHLLQVQDAIREIREEINQVPQNTSATNNKRVYSSMQADPVAPTEEQTEAYHRIKKMKNDPMNYFIGKDY